MNEDGRGRVCDERGDCAGGCWGIRDYVVDVER